MGRAWDAGFVMTETITRLYDSDAAAERAVQSLESASAGSDERSGADTGVSRPSRSLGGVVAAIGGVVAIALVLVLLAIPGVGAIVFGAIAGALIHRAMAETAVEVRSEKIRPGTVLVTARVPDRDRRRLEAMLDRTTPGGRNLRFPLRKAS
jgi:hypothetical protein